MNPLRLLLLLPALGLVSCAATGGAPSGPGPQMPALMAPAFDHIGVTGVLGRARLDEGELSEVDSPTTFGIEVDAYADEEVVGFEGGFLYGDDDSSGEVSGTPFRVETTFLELFGGVRKTFTVGPRWRPYVAGGVSWIHLDAQLDTLPGGTNTAGNTLGAYGRVGAYYRLDNSMRVGLDYRMLVGSDADGRDTDYSQFALTVGFSF